MKCSKFKHSGTDTKDITRWYKGPHRSLRCEVLDSSSELRSQLTSQSSGGSPKDPQARIEQLKLSKTDPSTCP
jgi:hypothetical protein